MRENSATCLQLFRAWGSESAVSLFADVVGNLCRGWEEEMKWDVSSAEFPGNVLHAGLYVTTWQTSCTNSLVGSSKALLEHLSLGAAKHLCRLRPLLFPPQKKNLITLQCWCSLSSAERLSVPVCPFYVHAVKKKGGLSEGRPLALLSLLLSFPHCPLAPCVTWWGFDKCLSWHYTVQADGHECTHPSDNSSPTLVGKRSSWECPNYYGFRIYKYIIRGMLQSLFLFWSRIRATKGQVFVVLRSAIMWRKWNWVVEGNAPSFAFCGKSCSINQISFFLSQLTIYE